ncbi:FIST signal transduction protein [Algoriphagus halophilus]|uniref:Uncharacterized conserved protein, contains FIST_N domain n=1 Tax=Algoriphagus halophilus TaxID=226505 RepID=A0A1N6G1T9_9BACT|nr:FIST N-terminal domain-containing protein [Algoriphagus halophilus]SIO01519.1 Uncharacterized conserved protein, contains FIST_N domain [Algoriphagus halophilus]
MKSKSIHGKSPEEIQKAIQSAIADDFIPTLAVVFISVVQDRQVIREILSKYDIDVFGATSCGEFVNGHQSNGETALLLMDLARDSYSILLKEIGVQSIQEVVKQVANSALSQYVNPSMIVCSTGVTPTSELFDGITLVQELTEAIGPEKIFFGGMAGDDFTLAGTAVFTKTHETNHGLIVLVFDADKVSLNGMAITGWKRLGISRKVTHSKGKLLYSIDGKPAVDMYLNYLGKGKEGENREFNVLNELSFYYPFIVERESSDDILIKSPMSIDYEENALNMDMEMVEGERFWFSVPPDFDIVQEITDEARKVRNNLGKDADALLVFSCAGREPALGPLVTIENEGLAEVWNSPMAGFFTYGEFGRAKNSPQNFHSTACCWVALKEK